MIGPTHFFRTVFPSSGRLLEIWPAFDLELVLLKTWAVPDSQDCCRSPQSRRAL